MNTSVDETVIFFKSSSFNLCKFPGMNFLTPNLMFVKFSKFHEHIKTQTSAEAQHKHST